MEQITEALSVFSSWAVSVTAIVAALSAVFKPFRKAMTAVRKKICGDTGIERIQKQIETLDGKIDSVSEKADDNEKDRLRSELFRYGNYARKGAVITSEEYRLIQRMYTKYEKLGGNDIAHDEYEFIRDYYNSGCKQKKSGG